MRKKSVLTVAAFAALTITSNAAGAQPLVQIPTLAVKTTKEPGCTACDGSAPIMLAQLGPRRGQVLQANEAVGVPRPELVGEGGAPRICCDPAMNIPISQFASMFRDDPATGNITSNFGFTFHPTSQFTAAVNNTAFMANTLLGLPFSHFIIRAEMRTDDQSHQAFSGSLAATWNGFSRVVRGWNQNFYVEDSPLNFVMAANQNPFTLALNSPGDMVRDGRRYIVKFTYWVAYFDNRREWVARQVICNNVPDRYIGINKDTVGFKSASGSSGSTIVVFEDAPSTAPGSGMSFGKPVPLRPEEIQMLQKGK